MRRSRTAWVVTRTEAVRQARRASTWWLRTAWALGISVAIGLAWTVAVGDPRMDLGTLGRQLFGTWRGALLVLAVGAAPLVVALGGVEDRDEGALHLLVLAGLRPGWILVGRTLARLLGIATVVLGALPIVAWTVSLGGVSPWEVVNATANALLVMLLLGTLAGLLATVSGQVVVPVLAALTWGWLAFLVVPSLFEYALYTDLFLGWRGEGLLGRWLDRVARFGFALRPGAEILSPVAAMGAASASGLLPVGLGALLLGVLALGTGPGWRAILGAEGRRGSWRWGGFVGFQAGVVAWAVGVRWPSPTLIWLGAVLLLLAGTALFVDLALWSLGGSGPRPRPPRLGQGIAWRELRESPPWRWWLAAGWAAVLVVGWQGGVRLGAALLVVGGAAVLLAATSSVTREISRGTLAPLLATTLPRHRIFAEKVGVVALQALPVLGLGQILLRPEGVLAAATLGLAYALACMGLAFTLRPPRRAWTANLLLGALGGLLLARPGWLPGWAALTGIAAAVAAVCWVLALLALDRRGAAPS